METAAIVQIARRYNGAFFWADQFEFILVERRTR
jgi:hypothetical protein